MANRKQLINEIANKVFEHLLLEVGERVKPYDFEVAQHTERETVMTFTIPPDTEYNTPVKMFVYFTLQSDARASLVFTASTGSTENINRNQVYRTMSTVIACIEYFLQESPDIQFLVYSGTDRRRENLYKAYLKKALQTSELGDDFEELDNGSGVVRKFNAILGITFKDLIHKKERKELRGANLRLYHLKGAYLQHADLQHTDLYKAKLQHAQLQHAQLQHAQLQHADLSKAELLYANFQYAELQSADLTDVKNLETCEGLDTVKYNKYTIWPDGFDIHKYQK